MPGDTSDFDQFYAEKIEPQLPRLKESQGKSRAWKTGMIFTICVAVLYFVGIYVNGASGDGWIILLLVLAIIICFYKAVDSNDVFSDEHKTLVVTEVLNYVVPGIIFKPDKKVPAQAFRESRLYQYDYNYYDGNDYMEGVVDGIRFQCSELFVACNDPDGSGSLSVFKGLFFVGALSGQISGGTFIWPRKEHAGAEQLNKYYELLPIKGTQKIITGDNGFDQYFRLRSSSPSEAGFILTEERRHSMLRMCQATQLPLSFSFVAGRCYVGLPLNDNLLEASTANDISKEDVKKHHVTISLIAGVIRQLSLRELL